MSSITTKETLCQVGSIRRDEGLSYGNGDILEAASSGMPGVPEKAQGQGIVGVIL